MGEGRDFEAGVLLAFAGGVVGFLVLRALFG